MRKIICVAAAAFIALAGCQSEQKLEYRFPGFDRVNVDHDDQVAREAGKLFDSYQAQVERDASNSHSIFASEYNKFAAKVRQQVELPRLSAESDRDVVLAANEKLNNYLAPRGWLLRIVDSYGTDDNDESIVVRVLMVGKLHSSYHGSMRDVRGKQVAYTETIVDEVKQTRTREKSFRLTSFTEGTAIYHFIDGFEWSARRVVEDCRDGSADGAEFSQFEWGGGFEELGATPEFETSVMTDLIRSSSVHERQHVVDHELGAMRLVKGDAAIAKVKLLMEIRGLLAQIASGGVEVYGLGHAIEWESSSEMVNRLAGWAVVSAIGRLPKDGDMRKFLAHKAAKELKVSDQLALAAIRHKDDPDPVDRAKKEHEQGR